MLQYSAMEYNLVGYTKLTFAVQTEKIDGSLWPELKAGLPHARTLARVAHDKHMHAHIHDYNTDKIRSKHAKSACMWKASLKLWSS